MGNSQYQRIKRLDFLRPTEFKRVLRVILSDPENRCQGNNVVFCVVRETFGQYPCLYLLLKPTLINRQILKQDFF